MTDVAGLGGGYGDSEPDAAPTVAAVLDAVRPGDREAQLVVISGPPGVGKSLLASSLCKTCGTTSIDKDWSAGGFILEASAQVEDGQNAAYDGPRYWKRLRPLEYAGA
ncbi:MAG: AAA family ATPase, partial [Gemmatimonadetes bacterium]|nr:AAA family ATPase [Gemmatimonadota bacterium]